MSKVPMLTDARLAEILAEHERDRAVRLEMERMGGRAPTLAEREARRGLPAAEEHDLARRLLDEGMPANEWARSGVRAVMVVDPSRKGCPLPDPRLGRPVGPGVIAVRAAALDLAGERAHLGIVHYWSRKMNRYERLSPAGRAWEWAAGPVGALVLAVAAVAALVWGAIALSPPGEPMDLVDYFPLVSIVLSNLLGLEALAAAAGSIGEILDARMVSRALREESGKCGEAATSTARRGRGLTGKSP